MLFIFKNTTTLFSFRTCFDVSNIIISHCIWVVIYTDHFCKPLLYIHNGWWWCLKHRNMFRKLKSVVVFSKIIPSFVLTRPLCFLYSFIRIFGSFFKIWQPKVYTCLKFQAKKVLIHFINSVKPCCSSMIYVIIKPNIMFTHNVIYIEAWRSRNGL